MNKAQASVELLIILAVSMIAIGLILILSNNEITNINAVKANSEAQNTVNKIAGAAEEVFISGVGTKKQIFVSIPSGVDETKTSVGNKTIRLNVNGTDLIAETQVEVTGSIPTTVGGHWIWITSYPGYVVIGGVQVETDKGSVYSTIAQDASVIESITVINNTLGNAQVNVSVNWTETEVTLSVSDNAFIVASGSNYSIDLNFTSSANAVGNYVGELIFDVNTVDGNKQIVVPLTLEVIVGGGGQPLMIFPDSWNPTIEAGTSDSNDFQVCNTTNSALTNIVFTPSTGDAGDWVQAIPSISSLEGNTCEQITVTIDVPDGASSDTGTVTGSDGTNSDFISLDVTVPVGDIIPPVVLLEAPEDGYISTDYTVQFDYNVVDADSGIAFCELIIDEAVDQTDNTITEGVTQSFTKTFTQNKNYIWDVNCVDDSVNSNEGTSGENRSIRIQVTGPTIIAFHTFPDLSWSSGTGWLAAWNNSGDASITVRGTAHSSPNHLRLRRGTGYAERSVDLSSYTNPRLEFWAKIASFEAGDTALVSVSSDGIIWTIVKTFTSTDSDNTYHFYEFDLNAFALSSEFWIAFDAEMSNPNDYFYIDDVNIVQRTP